MTHAMMTAMMGTARHLLTDHRLPPDLVDVDDTYGLAVDHLTLHGARVRANGSVDFTMALLIGDPL